MFFSNLFRQNKKKRKKSHIKNLIEVALSDGQMDENEMALLLNLARRLNIEMEEIQQIRQNPHLVQFHPPRNPKERFDQIYDLVCMMMVNGSINKNELELCKILALKLGYMPLIVDDFVKLISENISQGVSSEESYDRIYKMIG